jgi:hypothetical protein
MNRFSRRASSAFISLGTTTCAKKLGRYGYDNVSAVLVLLSTRTTVGLLADRRTIAGLGTIFVSIDFLGVVLVGSRPCPL